MSEAEGTKVERLNARGHVVEMLLEDLQDPATSEAEAPVDPDNAGLRNANRVRNPEWTSWETVEPNSLTLLQEQARRISGYIIILAIRPWDIKEPELGLEAVELKVWQGSCDGPEGPKHLVDAGFTHYVILREQANV